jgi:poly(beta-D-mannuronate) lyase
VNGFITINSKLIEKSGIPYPEKELPKISSKGFGFIHKDIIGNKRGNKLTIGAIQNDNQISAVKTIEELTGINWYNSENPVKNKKVCAKIYYIKNPSKNLSEIIGSISSGGIIEITDSGTFLIDETFEISKNVTIRSSKNLAKKPVLKYSGRKSGFSFFILINGGTLSLEGIVFSGESNGEYDPENVILAKAPMIEHYKVKIEDCEFFDFTEANFSILKGEKNTYADSISVQNSLFREMSCDAINLASEKDDNGKYNVEYLIVRNCIFHKIMGNAINLYRGGNDESTLGPFLLIDHCIFSDVNNREAGSVLRMIGVQNASIKNSIFHESGKGGYIARFDEMVWDKCKLEYCNIYNSGKIGSNNDKIAGEGINNTNPGLNQTNQLFFKLAPDVSSKMKTTDGAEMGCNWQDNKLSIHFK